MLNVDFDSVEKAHPHSLRELGFVTVCSVVVHETFKPFDKHNDYSIVVRGRTAAGETAVDHYPVAHTDMPQAVKFMRERYGF